LLDLYLFVFVLSSSLYITKTWTWIVMGIYKWKSALLLLISLACDFTNGKCWRYC